MSTRWFSEWWFPQPTLNTPPVTPDASVGHYLGKLLAKHHFLAGDVLKFDIEGADFGASGSLILSSESAREGGRHRNLGDIRSVVPRSSSASSSPCAERRRPPTASATQRLGGGELLR
jgi:hypothetical protein